MSNEYSAGVAECCEIARGAARFRRFLIAHQARFATFWASLVAGGIAIGFVSIRAELYGFAFSGLVGALAAAMMVWMAIAEILDIRRRTDREILFLGPPRKATAPSGDQASAELPPS
jgi:hypothetical protein